MELSPIKIRIKGLSVYAHHGVFDFEKAYGQEFLVDAEVSIKPTSSDDLANTLSYADLADALVADAKQNPVDLIETLAQRLLAVTFEIGGPAVSKAKAPSECHRRFKRHIKKARQCAGFFSSYIQPNLILSATHLPLRILSTICFVMSFLF